MMKKNLGALLLCAILGISTITFQACDDPTEVGVGIVTGAGLPIQEAKFDVEFSQLDGSPIATYTAGGLSQLNHAQCGILQDDVFGRTEASFSMQFHTINKQLRTNPNRIVDSVHLFLYLDSLSTYGDVLPISIKVSRLDQTIDGTQNYMSDDIFEVGNELATIEFTPNFRSGDQDSLESGPFIKIALPADLGIELFSLDSAILARDSAFIENFHGIQIQAVGVSDYLLGFKPFRTTDQSVRSSIRISYFDSIEQDTPVVLALSPTDGYFISPVVQHYEFDHTGSAIEDNLNNNKDSVLYIQGHGGAYVNMRIPNITDLGGVAVNKAELFIPFNDNALNYRVFNQLKTLYLTIEGLGGNQQFIPEFFETNAFNISPIGQLDTIEGEIGYFYNIPLHAQNLIDGTIFDMNMRIQSASVSTDDVRREIFGPLTLGEASARSVIFSQHLSEAVKLKISYTDIE